MVLLGPVVGGECDGVDIGDAAALDVLEERSEVSTVDEAE